jgi:hypothetical protein
VSEYKLSERWLYFLFPTVSPIEDVESATSEIFSDVKPCPHISYSHHIGLPIPACQTRVPDCRHIFNPATCGELIFW